MFGGHARKVLTRSAVAIALMMCGPGAGICNTIAGPGIVDNVVVCNTTSSGVSCTSESHQVNAAAFFTGTVAGGGTQISVTGFADGTGGPGALKAFSSFTSLGGSYFTQVQSNVQ